MLSGLIKKKEKKSKKVKNNVKDDIVRKLTLEEKEIMGKYFISWITRLRLRKFGGEWKKIYS